MRVSLQTMMKPSLHCDKELYNIKFCTNLGYYNCQPWQNAPWFFCRQSLAYHAKPTS